MSVGSTYVPIHCSSRTGRVRVRVALCVRATVCVRRGRRDSVAHRQVMGGALA